MGHTVTSLETASARLLTVASIQDMVAVLRDTARAVAGADGIAVVLREGDFCAYVAEDAMMPLWRGTKFRLEECISGWTMLNDQAVIVPDIWNDLRVPVAAYQTKSVRSLVMTPIGSPAPIAALGAYWCAWVEPDKSTVQRLQALADAATAAVTRLRSGQADPIASLLGRV
ncbi:GAF domain-containing protein [Methylorubrum zatmanii]|uniref:GAF domain-containing protein n=1 Tax=Methylorubrum zatmanii TaxID=29429 RepID=A0ABW1WV46_9HYPH|nr:GAF domain-containing protein [Methylorubrum zatmanii]MBD8909523.1 GAF domain-containing protein [Methylorubrum zatmanii]